MKPTRLAIAAAVLCGISGIAFAQSSATIIQSGSYDQATIDQNGPAGSVLSGRIVQSRGEENLARIRQEPGASGGAVQASASISQWGTGFNAAVITQTGTGGGTTAEFTQEGNGNNGGEVVQANVSAATARASQNANSSGLTIRQVAGSSSVYAEGRQVGDGWGSGLIITQGDDFFGGAATNSQALILQNAEAGTAQVAQRLVDNASGYISQGGGERPGYYFSSLTNSWVEVDGSVAGGFSNESYAVVGQGPGSFLTGYILQYGSFNEATVGQAGSNQLGGILQTGSGNHGDITQMGSFNTASIRQYGNGGWASLFQNGTGNTASIRQR